MDTNAAELIPLNMTQLKGVFLFLLIGNTLGIIVFLIELFGFHYMGQVFNYLTHIYRVLTQTLQIFNAFRYSNRVNTSA